MAKVGLAFLSAILGVVFDKVVSPKVVDFMQGRKLTEGLLRKLKTTVLSVNAVLEDAEEKEHTKPFVRDWIDELKDTLYDAEDILDEIATKALRCKLDAEFQTTTGKVRNSISAFLNPFIHHLEPKIQELQVTLKKNLNGKKFLLVLDDVWSEKPIHQELLGQLLHYGAQGSKILITTRNEKVALAMHAIATHHHHLKLLPQDVCWSLFEKHAFLNGSSSNTDPKIREIGPQIVEKCKGLPLAIKAIGDLLWSESDVKKWMNILKSDLWDLPPEKTTILPALRLSYKYLPSDLKHCFAYCSIFPKDYIFEKDQLVLLWMVEGFLQQFVIETMEEVGNRYFDALVSRSLFQQSLKTNSGFVMHDLVNDLAKFMTGQFGFTRLKGDSSKEIGKMTRYLLYFGRNSGNFKKNEEDLYKAKQLRTFLALDSINRLPNSICMLCNLQTLKLSKCYNLDRLPRDMWKLINLRHLEIDGTRKLKEMPIQMGKLKCLQTLSNFILSKHSGSCIGELGKLINLQGKLLIQKLEYVRSAYDALDASLKDKGYLEELVL
ncbi:putative disease resistance RPP13-like protein 1 [Carya illinoinensis]|uniref:putative disease resistance RPP13-like protein 1 n=1 Tax=Carya illinoinensis TaxID=32201 RepID=UPI001C71B06C|nr:putative disease resistance RPP13-like protein 1 [Carya illinoinensis]